MTRTCSLACLCNRRSLHALKKTAAKSLSWRSRTTSAGDCRFSIHICRAAQIIPTSDPSFERPWETLFKHEQNAGNYTGVLDGNLMMMKSPSCLNKICHLHSCPCSQTCNEPVGTVQQQWASLVEEHQ